MSGGLRPQGAGKTLMNMLRSHNAAYHAVKAMPGAENVAIGLVHNVFWLEPKGKGPLYFHVRRGLSLRLTGLISTIKSPQHAAVAS